MRSGRLVWRLVVTILAVAGLLQGAGGAEAQESPADQPTAGASAAEMARAAQNPLANVISVPFQDNTSFEIGPYERTQNVLNLQPVVPLAGGRVITRTIVPYVWQPDVTAPSGTSTGFGDLQLTAFYSPASQGYTWGVGPILSLPTGGSERGTQKWSAGASAVVVAMPGPWVVGLLVNNIWSLAGEEERADVNQMLVQYFLNYNFGKTGWYLSSAPIITANWEAAKDDRWTVPVGLAAGKVIKVGGRGVPVNLQAGAFYNVVAPDQGPAWSTRVQVAVMLPASIL